MQHKRSRSATLTATLMLGLSLPAHAEDALGQFLDQNFPTIYAAESDDDPIRAFAERRQAQATAAQNVVHVQPALNHNFQPAVESRRSFAETFNSNNPSSYAYVPMLNARSALVMHANTGKILYQKNMDAVRSIASISKLMAAMVVLDANLNMNEQITITAAEIDRLKGTGSRLSVGTVLTRGELLHLGLMSSENRAIHALGRTYPGGMGAFVAAMNAKARSLGMSRTRFVEPTGLDPRNVSTARDLSLMVRSAHNYPRIRQLSTSNYGSVYTSAGKTQTYKNTNALVREGVWNISLQKTGYIREAGRSMVLQAQMGKDPVVIVVLGSATSASRVNDARALRNAIQMPL